MFARVGAIAAVLALGLVPGGASASTPAWRVQPGPTPAGATDAYLTSVSCTSATACTAVGTSLVNFTTAHSVAEAWNGTKWKIQRTPAAGTLLNGVSCTSASQCVTVGSGYNSVTSSTTALTETWNGTKWVVTRTRIPAGSTYSSLGGVSCTSATACVAVGSYYDAAGVSQPLAETWNGAKWALAHPKVPAGSHYTSLGGVSCTSTTACTAVGSWSTNGADFTPLAEIWNGTSWTTQTVPVPAGSVNLTLTAVSCTSTTACTAAGYFHAGSASGATKGVIEGWNGAVWTVASTPAFAGGLFAVSCASASACIAAGGAGTSAAAETWDGATWTLQPVQVPSGSSIPSLFGVSCAAASACTAVGSTNNSSGHLQPVIERYS